jgi:tetratricopeptide (TPR) repeat protein
MNMLDQAYTWLRRLLPSGGSAGFLHWLYMAMAVLLPLAFSLNLMPAFSAIKVAFFVSGTAALALASLFWLRRRERALRAPASGGSPQGVVQPIKFSLQREHIYLLCFIGWLFLSILWAPDFSAALASFLSFFAAAFVWFLYVLFYRNEDKDNRKQFALIQVIVVVGMIEAVLILFQYFGLGFQFSEGVGGSWRVLGTFGNATFAAEFLVAVFFLALNLLHHETNAVYRRLYSSAVLFIFLAIIATWSRSGLILLCLGFVFYSWIFARVQGQSIKVFFRFVYGRVKSYLLLLCAGLALILVIYPFLSMDRGLARQVTDLDLVTERVFIWERSLKALWSNLPLGTGAGGYSAAYAEAKYAHFSSGAHFDLARAGRVQEHAHNDLLEFAVELGLGCIFIALFFGRIIRRGMRDFCADDLSIGSFTALAILLLSSFINFPMHVTPTLYLLMLLAALVSTHRRMEDDAGVRRIRLPVISNRIFIPVAVVAAFAILWSCGLIFSSFSLRSAVTNIEKGERDSALGTLRLAVMFNPANALAQTRLAALAYEFGDEARAFRASKKSIRILPQAEAYRIQALLAEEQGRDEEALEYWRKRSYIYRWVPSYTADYIRSLLDFERRDEVFREALTFNELVARLHINSAEWADAAARVNGAALMASLLPVRIFCGQGEISDPDSQEEMPQPAQPSLVLSASAHPLSLGVLENTVYVADARNIFVLRDGEARFIEDHGGSFCGFMPAADGLLYASSDTLMRLSSDGRRTVFARGLAGVRSLAPALAAAGVAAVGESFFAGMQDGRLLLVGRTGTSLLARYDRAVTAIAAAGRGKLFIALEGGTVLQLDRASMRTERVFDESEGIIPGNVSSLIAFDDTLLIAVEDAGVFSFNLSTGTLRRSLPGQVRGRGVRVRQILPALPGQNFALALDEGRLVLLSKTGRKLLSFEGGPSWPRSIDSAAFASGSLAGNDRAIHGTARTSASGSLVVVGESGILLYPDFMQALIPYAEYLEAAQ